MLEQLSDQVRGCYERAAEARAKADATNDPALRVEFLDMEKRWLMLARSYGFTESLTVFTTANSRWRRWFDQLHELIRDQHRRPRCAKAWSDFCGSLPLSNPVMTQS